MDVRKGCPEVEKRPGGRTGLLILLAVEERQIVQETKNIDS